MKYMLLMNVPAGGWYVSDSWTPAEMEAHLAYWRSLNADLRASGELVVVEALTEPGRARRVRAGDDGLPITDGVFPEAKEFLAGYWIIDVAGPQRAEQIAARASAAPGPAGAPLNMTIEVRAVMDVRLVGPD